MLDEMMDLASVRSHIRRTKQTASSTNSPSHRQITQPYKPTESGPVTWRLAAQLSNRYHRLFHLPRHLPALFSARRMSRLLTRMSLANARNSVESDALACGPSAGDQTNAWCHAVERSRSHRGVKACRQAGTRYFT
jgi:hypothetical protein